MKNFFICILACLLLSCGSVCAKTDTNPKDLPTTEKGLIGKIINCLQYKDTNTYVTLFPDFDTLWKQVTAFHTDVNEEQQLNYIRQYPERVRQFDPYYNHAIVENFQYVVDKGEKEGIHWNQIVMASFEVKKQILTRDMVGYQVIAPTRFRGYVFVKDMITRKTYGFTVTEMQNIEGFWYGGQVINIFEANDIEEYQQRLADETKKKRMMQEYGLTEADIAKQEDSARHLIKVEEDADDDEAKPNKPNGLAKKNVVDRKLFIGKFDNEIPVRLYIRYLQGNCPEGVCSWEAIYKFGDQEEYVKLDVSKTPDGTWQFLEDPPTGSMDLTLNGKVFTGTWATTDIQTGYDVKLSEAALPPAEAQDLDNIIQRGLWSKGKEEEEAKDKAKKQAPGKTEGLDDVY